MSQIQWEDFLVGLAEIETKYWSYLRGTHLAECYVLGEDENGVLSFEFNNDCELAEHIKEECFLLFGETKARLQYNSRRQG